MTMQSENIDQLADALAKAQGAMKAAVFNRTNPHFKSSYADLAAIWEAVRGPLSAHGLSVTQQTVHQDGQGYVLLTVLRHASGQWCSSQYPLPVGLKAQELGAWRTYLRRYELSAIVGIAAEADDDGEAIEAAALKADTTTISPEHAAAIETALGVRNMPLERMTKWASWKLGRQIEAISELPESLYKEALDRIRTAGDPQ